MKQRDIEDLMLGMAPVILEAIKGAVEPLKAEIADLQETIAALKAAPVSPPAAVSSIELKVDAADLQAAVSKAVEGITLDPADERFRAVVREELARAIADLPPPKDGEPGKSVSIDDVLPAIVQAAEAQARAAVEAIDVAALVDAATKAAVAELPPAEPGKPGTSVTVEEVIPIIKETIAGEVRAEIDHGEAVAQAIRANVMAVVAELPPAEPGKSVSIDDVRPLVDEAVAKQVGLMPGVTLKQGVEQAVAEALPPIVADAVAALPKPKDGEPGKNVDPATVVHMVSEAVTNAAGPMQAGVEAAIADMRQLSVQAIDEIRAAVPTAEAVAALIPKPEDGKSVSIDELRPAIEAIAKRYVDALPTPEDGLDGVGIVGSIIDRSGNLVFTRTDGSTLDAGRVVGPAGDDGLGFDEISIEDKGTTFEIVFRMGDREKRFVVAKPTLADSYRGVWREGEFKRGDTVTWGGSLFLAKADTKSKPATDETWQLVVKRGNDGRSVKEPTPKEPAKITGLHGAKK